ncbi:unnamed protein product [Symbiodinium natans]|uniref:Kinesin-like protein n=1 Tax=Symbiodinium natans TaxID=878477 RepID=A0A812IE23_9DINO|nr:unnamed protein product [Symbiodinium natans]
MGSGASLDVSSSEGIHVPVSTEKMVLEKQHMDDADAFFSAAATFNEDEKRLFSRMVGYVAKTCLGGIEYSMPLRCLQAVDALEAPESRVALCLHGFGDDRCMALWSHFWLPMTQEGFHVVALDLPGFGRASGKPGSTKDWSSLDGELLLRLMECLRIPSGCASVFAEGIGACAFLRAYAQDPTPFAAHHVLLNVQIGEVPKGLRENLESRGADIMLCGCEKFYPAQPPWMLSGLNQLSALLLDPSTMGLLGTFVLWKVKDADGPTPIRSMKDGTWWTGSLEKTALAHAGHALVFRASPDCFQELFQYVRAPPRKVAVKTSPLGPEMTSIEMGEINDTFSVFIRIRPLLERELKVRSENCLAVSDTDFPRDPPPQRILVQSGDSSLKGSYVFNRVFEQSMSQEAVYNSTAKPFVQDFLAGTNVTIFAYGQTGTGKTYTIFGPPEDPGIVTRSLSDIFEKLPADKDLHYEYVQLYLDDFKDLLADAAGLGKLVEGKAGVELVGLSSQKATSASEILQAVAKGATRRATRAQDMNEVSSRSHAILMLRLKHANSVDIFSSMFIVDLAGSERVARSGVTGDGFAEATNVNLSLTALGRVVMSLIEADINQTKGFIPYNASPLTMLLKAGLGGDSKTALIACVTQAADSLSESVSTLRFAMQASHVKNKVEQKQAQDQADQEKAKIAEAANELRLSGGKGTVALTAGDIEVWGTWQSAAEETVILLGGLGSELEELEGLIAALRDVNHQVLAPKLLGTAEKHLDSDVAILLELCDWLGLAKPVFYGRDWGAVRAVRYKMVHPKRAGNLVLENRLNKMDEAQYKAKVKKDPNFSLQEYMGPWLWFFDGTFPKSFDGSGFGKNVKGFKGKVLFLWPYHTKGRHDPPKKVTACSKFADAYAKAVKTKPVDSYLMTDADVAARIVGFAE